MKKLICIVAVFTISISINLIVSAKYIGEEQFEIANLEIDRTKPKIEVLEINNSNKEYENYANKTHKIDINVKVIEKNIGKDSLNPSEIKIQVGNKEVNIEDIKITETKRKEDEIYYKIELNSIPENGELVVIIEKGAITDTAGWKSDEKKIQTKIQIDNIKPNAVFQEKILEEGIVLGTINTNEGIRNLEGWNKNEQNTKWEKDFTNNITYEIPIIDYAQNENIVKINITKATYIKITYASHNSYTGWSFGYGNNDIAGIEAIKNNPIYKTEALAFNIEGNMSKDFIKFRTYIYTHWGEGSKAICTTTKQVYKYGYNPEINLWDTMENKKLVKINNKEYLQLGGSGVNAEGQGDINGENKISAETSSKCLYGISGIAIDLKEKDKYSIIYQVYLDKIGWIKPASDGEECMYKNNMPISAYRMTLVPKSEKEHVLNTWSKDVGKIII